MISCRLQHDDRPDLRAFIISEEPPTVKHFYLEKLCGKDWARSRRIGGEWFERYMNRLGFDLVEAYFMLEERADQE